MKSDKIIRILIAAAFMTYGIINHSREIQSNPKNSLVKNNSKIKGEYYLVTDEDLICRPYVKNLNLFRDIDFDDCNARLSNKYPELRRPSWKALPFKEDIAEKAFKDLSLDSNIGTSEVEKKWQRWLNETSELRSKKKIAMWQVDVDINNDGMSDPIVRVQYGNSSVEGPVKNKSCVYSQSALIKLSPNSSKLYSGLNHFYFGWNSDIIFYEKTKKTYAIATTNIAVDPGMIGQRIGATRGLIVSLAPGAQYSLLPVCHVAWVPSKK